MIHSSYCNPITSNPEPAFLLFKETVLFVNLDCESFYWTQIYSTELVNCTICKSVIMQFLTELNQAGNAESVLIRS